MYHFVTDRMHRCSFFAEAQRIVTEDYVPSMEDILHISQHGIMKTYFNFGQLNVRVLQVHSQQGYVRKWIHLFEGVASLMFCISLSDYDEPSGVGQQVCVCRFFCPRITCVTMDHELEAISRIACSFRNSCQLVLVLATIGPTIPDRNSRVQN